MSQRAISDGPVEQKTIWIPLQMLLFNRSLCAWSLINFLSNYYFHLFIYHNLFPLITSENFLKSRTEHGRSVQLRRPKNHVGITVICCDPSVISSPLVEVKNEIPQTKLERRLRRRPHAFWLTLISNYVILTYIWLNENHGSGFRPWGGTRKRVHIQTIWP